MIGQGGDVLIASNRSISRWNCLALVAALTGAGGTLALDQWTMVRWVDSGEHVPVGERTVVELGGGSHTIYYESPIDVPVPGQAHLHVLGPDDEPVPVSHLADDMNYRLPWTGWSGREMWRVELPEPGLYEVACYNLSHPSDDHVPREDRIALQKYPATFDEASRSSRTVRHIGAALTILLVIGLYVQHLRTMYNAKEPS